MAIIRTLPGNPGPVNQGEEIVLAYLVKELPDTIILIPNITINYDRDGAEEHDILAVGPDGVFVIEVKTLAGNVEINEQIMLVDGPPSYRDPHDLVRNYRSRHWSAADPV